MVLSGVQEALLWKVKGKFSAHFGYWQQFSTLFIVLLRGGAIRKHCYWMKINAFAPAD